MQKVMKRREVLVLIGAIEAVGDVKGSLKWIYALDKNRRKLMPELEMVRNLQTSVEKDRIALCQELADKDENGKPLLFAKTDEKGNKVGEEFSIKDRKPIEELLVSKQKELDELLGMDITVDLHLMKMCEIPENAITPKQFSGIMDLIDETP